MQPEAKVTKKIREYLIGAGAFVFKVHGGPTMMAGLPDLVACCDGLFIGIEVKMPGNKTSAVQDHVHTKITEAGGAVIVAYGVEDVQQIIQPDGRVNVLALFGDAINRGASYKVRTEPLRASK